MAQEENWDVPKHAEPNEFEPAVLKFGIDETSEAAQSGCAMRNQIGPALQEANEKPYGVQQPYEGCSRLE